MSNIIIPARPGRPVVVGPTQPAAQVRIDAGGRIPPGGAAGQNLVKLSGDDFATGWGSAAADWSSVTNKPTFATVATTGDYADLIGKPNITVSTDAPPSPSVGDIWVDTN